jgi:hypothetical protein
MTLCERTASPKIKEHKEFDQPVNFNAIVAHVLMLQTTDVL